MPLKQWSVLKQALSTLERLQPEAGEEPYVRSESFMATNIGNYQKRKHVIWSIILNLRRLVYAMCNMQEFGIQSQLTMTSRSRTTTSRRKEVCTWNYVCVEKPSDETSDTHDNVK